MSDDGAYADFLNQANRHVSTGGTGEQAARTAQSDVGLYLSSETDEPWTEFRQRGAKVDTAHAFARLVKEHGEAEFTTVAEDDQYQQAVQLVAGEANGKAAPQTVEVVQIKQGTRIHVFVVRYDEQQGSYVGLRSMKVES